MGIDHIKESIESWDRLMSHIFDINQDQNWRDFENTFKEMLIKSLKSGVISFSLKDFLFLTIGMNTAAQDLLNEEPLQLKSKISRMAFCLAIREYLYKLPNDKFRNEVEKYSSWEGMLRLFQIFSENDPRPGARDRFFKLSFGKNKDPNAEIEAIKESLAYADILELPELIQNVTYLDPAAMFLLTPIFQKHLQDQSSRLQHFSESVEFYLKADDFSNLNRIYKQDNDAILASKNNVSEARAGEKLKELDSDKQQLMDYLQRPAPTSSHSPRP
jgi:hypothetical protein